MPRRIARTSLFVPASQAEVATNPVTAHSRESGNPVWVLAFAGTSGKIGKDKSMSTKCPRGTRLTHRPVGWVERQRNPSLSRSWLGRGDGFHFVQPILRLPQRSHFNAGRGRLGNIAVLSVQFVTVPAA